MRIAKLGILIINAVDYFVKNVVFYRQHVGQQ